MNQVKKYLLVDPERMHQDVKPIDIVTHTVEKEMDNILKSKKPDDIKANLFASKKARKNMIKSEKIIEQDSTKYFDILDTSTPNTLYKTVKIINLLRKNPNVKLSKRGEFVYKNQIIQGSNVHDLLTDAVSNTDLSSIGIDKFANALKEINIPKKFITNKKLWNLLKPQNGQGVYKQKKTIKKVKNMIKFEKWKN